MRLEDFDSAGQEPIGEGLDRKVFIDPHDETRVISERKSESEHETHRQIKGRFYLTKILHLLLPKNIPNIHQVGESVDGIQTVDRERIAHSEGHAALVKADNQDEGMLEATSQLSEELGEEIWNTDIKISDIGLGFNIEDENIGNYLKNVDGNIMYLESFNPWVIAPDGLEKLYDEADLTRAIVGIEDEILRDRILKQYDRLQTLFEEEKEIYRVEQESNLLESETYVQKITESIDALLNEVDIERLQSFEDGDSAQADEERKKAIHRSEQIHRKLHFIEDKTNVTSETMEELRRKYMIVNLAIGTIVRINGVHPGYVDHTRR